MATVYGHARYGEQVYGDTSQATALPPRSHLGSQREEPVRRRQNAPPSAPAPSLYGEITYGEAVYGVTAASAAPAPDGPNAPPVILPRTAQTNPHREGSTAE